MKVRSSRWDTALRSSHVAATRVDVLDAGVPIISGLNATRWSIAFNGNAKTLATLSIELAEPTRIPASGGPLSPYGFELAVSRGITYADGITELMPLGVFPIQTSGADGVSLLSAITASDRSQIVSDAKFEDDYQVAAGTNYATAIRAVIEAGVTGLNYLFAGTAYTTPLLTFTAQSDRWDAVQSMAKSIGHRIYFDGSGNCVLAQIPNVANVSPAWVVDEGSTGVLKGINIDLDRGPAYNRVIAVSSNAQNAAVYRAVATDSNPASPSYYYGRFRRKPKFYMSPYIGSTVQAQAAADGLLAAGLGVARSMTLRTTPNPALEVWDGILVRRAVLGVDEVQIVDTCTIGGGAGDDMAIQSRSRTAA